MDFGNFLVRFITDFLGSAAILIGIFALIGAAILRKRGVELITTFFKTAIGFAIVQQGAGIIGNTLQNFQVAFSGLTSGLDGVIANNDATAASYLAFTPSVGNNLFKIAQLASIVYVFAFVFNILVAIITRNSNIYTTGQVALYFTVCLCSVASLVFDLDNGGSFFAAVVFCSLFMGLYMTISGSYSKRYMVRVFKREGITFGNTGSLGVSLGGAVGDLVARINKNKKYVSTESIQFPKALRAFNNTFVSTSVVILLIFLAVYVPMGIIFTWTNPERFTNLEMMNQMSDLSAEERENLLAVKTLFEGNNFLALAITDALTFAAGIEIVNFGVGIFVGEVIRSFKGISNKMVKGASAGLDTPTTFPFAPNAVIIGFIASILGSITVLAMSFGLSIATRSEDPNTAALFPIILPAVVPHFYNGGCMAVFANSKGGFKGVVVAGYVHGLFISFVPVAFYGMGLMPGLVIPNTLQNTVLSSDLGLSRGIGFPLAAADSGIVPQEPATLTTIWGDSDYYIIAVFAAFFLGVNQGQWIFLGLMFVLLIGLSGYKYYKEFAATRYYYRMVQTKLVNGRLVRKVVLKSKPIPTNTIHPELMALAQQQEQAFGFSKVQVLLKNNKVIRKVILNN